MGLFILVWSWSFSITGHCLALDTLGRSKPEQSPLSLVSHPPCLSTHSKLVIEPVSEQGVRQFSEVGLAQGGDTVNVLEVNIFPQVWLPLCLKLLPGEVQSGQEWWGWGKVEEVGAAHMGPGRVEGQRAWALEGGCWGMCLREARHCVQWV